MDKVRHPHVVRTWTVERTKIPYRPPQSAKRRPGARQGIFGAAEKNPHGPNSAPKRRR